jgi:preprotein translocase subunit YajC
MLQNLKKGDRVVTQGGLMGKITGITDKIIVLEIAEKVRVKVLKTQIAGLEASLTGSPEKK